MYTTPLRRLIAVVSSVGVFDLGGWGVSADVGLSLCVCVRVFFFVVLTRVCVCFLGQRHPRQPAERRKYASLTRRASGAGS